MKTYSLKESERSKLLFDLKRIIADGVMDWEVCRDLQIIAERIKNLPEGQLPVALTTPQQTERMELAIKFAPMVQQRNLQCNNREIAQAAYDLADEFLAKR